MGGMGRKEGVIRWKEGGMERERESEHKEETEGRRAGREKEWKDLPVASTTAMWQRETRHAVGAPRRGYWGMNKTYKRGAMQNS